MLKVDERCQIIPFSFNLSRFFLQETSDLTFMIEGKPVYVHKAMLKIRYWHLTSFINMCIP